MNGLLSDCEDPPDRADDTVSSRLRTLRLCEDPPNRADDAFSSRAMSLLFCEVIELLLEVTDSEDRKSVV